MRDLNEKSPALYREVVEKHADSPAAFDAATTLLRGAARNKLTADEAAKLVKIVQDQAVPFGPLFAATTLAPIADVLTRQPGLEAVALRAIESVANAITDDQPASLQSIVLSSYQNALMKAGKVAEAKELGGRIAKLEAKIDAEYLKTVPPFKPTMFAGRKDKEANQVVMMELFTGGAVPALRGRGCRLRRPPEVLQTHRARAGPVPHAHSRLRPHDQPGHHCPLGLLPQALPDGDSWRPDQPLQWQAANGRRRRHDRVGGQVRAVREGHQPATGEHHNGETRR